jgi:hypothetical protein
VVADSGLVGVVHEDHCVILDSHSIHFRGFSERFDVIGRKLKARSLRLITRVDNLASLSMNSGSFEVLIIIIIRSLQSLAVH